MNKKMNYFLLITCILNLSMFTEHITYYPGTDRIYMREYRDENGKRFDSWEYETTVYDFDQDEIAKYGYFSNGELNDFIYYAHEENHNNYGPSTVFWGHNGQVKSIQHRIDGLLNDYLDMPASVSFNQNGSISGVIRCKDGNLTNREGPAKFNWFDDGKLFVVVYYKDGCVHNDKGPARVTFYDNGNVMSIYYVVNGKIHNSNGPARLIWYYNGMLYMIAYYLNDKFHDYKKMPSYNTWYMNGQKEYEVYHVRGVIRRKREWSRSGSLLVSVISDPMIYHMSMFDTTSEYVM